MILVSRSNENISECCRLESSSAHLSCSRLLLTIFDSMPWSFPIYSILRYFHLTEILISSGVPVITDPIKVKDIVRKQIEWLGPHPKVDLGPGTDGWYLRSYGSPDGTTSSHMKIIVGTV